jgi:DNA primase large subunit
VSPEEQHGLKAQLEAVHGSDPDSAKTNYYKVCVMAVPILLTQLNHKQVRWTRVPDLVEKRRVFLRQGWAYVHSKEQSSIVFHEFETHLEKALEVCRLWTKTLLISCFSR